MSPIPHPQLPIHVVLGIEGEDVRSNSQVGRIAAHARQKRDDHCQTLRYGGDRKDVLQNGADVAVLPEHARLVTGRGNLAQHRQLVRDTRFVLFDGRFLLLFLT